MELKKAQKQNRDYTTQKKTNLIQKEYPIHLFHLLNDIMKQLCSLILCCIILILSFLQLHPYMQRIFIEKLLYPRFFYFLCASSKDLRNEWQHGGTGLHNCSSSKLHSLFHGTSCMPHQGWRPNAVYCDYIVKRMKQAVSLKTRTRTRKLRPRLIPRLVVQRRRVPEVRTKFRTRKRS